MHTTVEDLMADRNVSDERAGAAALCLADAYKDGQMDLASDLLELVKRYRPALLKSVADRLLSPRPSSHTKRASH